jgi:hypothetical protein
MHEVIMTQCLLSTFSADVSVFAASSKTLVLGDEGEGIGARGAQVSKVRLFTTGYGVRRGST